MKIIIQNAVIFILLIILGLTSFMPIQSKEIEVQGHRGSRGHMPENTLPSFALAIEAGADVLELDLLVTKDGELIIHHDFYLNKELCTHLDGSAVSSAPLIRSLPLAMIKQYDSGRKTNRNFPQQRSVPGTQIPTLQELFDFIKSSPLPNAKKVRLNLEIKRDSHHPEWTIGAREFAKKVIDVVEKNGFVDRIGYSSFDPEVLQEIRKLDPNAKIGFLFEEETFPTFNRPDPQAGMKTLIAIASSFKADTISPDHVLLKPEDVSIMKKSGFRVVAWTVNDPKRWAELIDMGVDGIITDFPDELIKFLDDRKL